MSGRNENQSFSRLIHHINYINNEPTALKVTTDVGIKRKQPTTSNAKTKTKILKVSSATRVYRNGTPESRSKKSNEITSQELDDLITKYIEKINTLNDFISYNIDESIFEVGDKKIPKVPSSMKIHYKEVGGHWVIHYSSMPKISISDLEIGKTYLIFGLRRMTKKAQFPKVVVEIEESVIFLPQRFYNTISDDFISLFEMARSQHSPKIGMVYKGTKDVGKPSPAYLIEFVKC